MAPSALKESVIDEVRGRMPKSDEDKDMANNNTMRFDLCMVASFPIDWPENCGSTMPLL